MNGYVCFYAGRRIEVYADSLFAAKEKAVAALKAPKSKRHMVSVMLAEKGGEPVVHNPGVL